MAFSLKISLTTSVDFETCYCLYNMCCLTLHNDMDKVCYLHTCNVSNLLAEN